MRVHEKKNITADATKGLNVMIRTAAETDRGLLVRYLSGEPVLNVAMLADIEYYGFDSPHQEVWIQEENGAITAVILRYFSCILCYHRIGEGELSEIAELVIDKQAAPLMVIGRVGDSLEPYLPGYGRNDKYLCELTDGALLPEVTEEIVTAGVYDALEIAGQYRHIREFDGLYAEAGELADNIRTRISSGEGIHMFMRRDGKIAAHGNTFAQTKHAAFVSGIFTLPDCRGKGYATQIVAALCRKLLDAGRTPVLSYDNPSAGAIYHRVGFRVIDRLSFFHAADA
jgi:predicted GNAT family acetyltransferase